MKNQKAVLGIIKIGEAPIEPKEKALEILAGDEPWGEKQRAIISVLMAWVAKNGTGGPIGKNQLQITMGVASVVAMSIISHPRNSLFFLGRLRLAVTDTNKEHHHQTELFSGFALGMIWAIVEIGSVAVWQQTKISTLANWELEMARAAVRFVGIVEQESAIEVLMPTFKRFLKSLALPIGGASDTERVRRAQVLKAMLDDLRATAHICGLFGREFGRVLGEEALFGMQAEVKMGAARCGLRQILDSQKPAKPKVAKKKK